MKVPLAHVIQGSGKRRRVVIGGEGSGDEASQVRHYSVFDLFGSNLKQSRPKKKAKTAKQSPSAPPMVTVVEIDSDSDEHSETKRGPSNTSRNHFHPPVAVKAKGEKRWEFKCRHCKT